MKFSYTIFATLLAVVSGASVAQAPAEPWPTKKPITLVVVFPPGGSVDQVARILAVPLQQQLGQTVIVENKGGASGAIGTAAVAKAEGDGYTFAVVFDTHAVNPALIANMPYDPVRDLTAVSLIGIAPMAIATPAGSDFKSWGDVTASAKTGKSVSYGTIGSGSLGHLAMTLVGKSNSLSFQHVPYKGGGPMMQDAVGGHVPLVIGSTFVVKPHVQSGRVRALAVTSSKRTAELPDVPTLSELGLSGFEAPAWWAILTSSKTPAPLVARMSDEINKALRNPDIAKRLSAQGIDIVGGSPEVAKTFIDKQTQIWGQVVRENGIKND